MTPADFPATRAVAQRWTAARAAALTVTVTAGIALQWPLSAKAAQTALDQVEVVCPGVFKFDAKEGKCAAPQSALDEKKTQAACNATAGLAWDASGSGTCKEDKAPAPACAPVAWNIVYSAKAKKCVLETSPDAAKSQDFFANWATGIAIIKPRVKSVTDAAVVPATAASGAAPTVRVNSEVRNESAILVARHFHPWNPGRRCAEGGRFTTKADDEALTAPITGFFASCTGMVVAAGLPTSGAVNGQILNFLGIGFSIGSGPTNETNPTAWHLGYGWGRKFNTRVLGDGWSENAPPPEGETQVRYKYVDVPARFLYFTVHW